MADPAFAVSWTGTKKLEGNFTDSVHCSDSAAYQTGCRSNALSGTTDVPEFALVVISSRMNR
jgi:hypothetical protein